MLDFEITLKNYRCFDDKIPATITIGSHFTALVGPNNSGKSSFLRFFHEMKQLFSNRMFQSTYAGRFDVTGAFDAKDIYCDRNDRDITIEISLPNPPQLSNRIDKIEITVPRNGHPSSRLFSHGVAIRVEKENTGIKKAEGKTVLQVQKQDYDITAISNVIDFGRSLYIGPFRNAITEGGARYHGLDIGTQFVETWSQWKSGNDRTQNQKALRTIEDIRHLFGFKSLDIDASHDRKTLAVTVDGRPYKLPELGGGVAQAIVIIANIVLKNPTFVFVDEPEMNLHPSLQMDFLTRLGSYGASGVGFATHSIGLARSVAESIYSFRRESESIKVGPFDGATDYGVFLGEMSYSSFLDLGYDKVLLVEGVTEVRLFQQYLRKLNADHRVVVLPLGGNALVEGEREHELAELKRLTYDIAGVVDSERTDRHSSPNEQRKAFLDRCSRLGINVHLTELRATENYFPEHAVTKTLGTSYSALGPYDRLKDAKNVWSKSDNWKIGQQMTKDELLATDIGEFLYEWVKDIHE